MNNLGLILLILKNVKCFKINEKWLMLFIYEIASIVITYVFFYLVNYRFIKASFLGIGECVFCLVFSCVYGFLLLVSIVLKLVRS